VTSAWKPTPVITEANTVTTPAGGWEGATAGVTESDRGALVKKIQTLLAEQGYDPGPADGFEGPKTRDAVRAFQRTLGMSETGQISADLADALAKT
jgi:localization factor PodJL